MNQWLRPFMSATVVLFGSVLGNAGDPWQADPALVEKLSASKTGFLYREADVPSYKLPDPLLFSDGNIVADSEQWARRRAETLELFRANVYGRRPETDFRVTFSVVSEKKNLFDVDAIGRSLTATISVADQTYSFPIYVFMPTKVEGPLPAVVHINNRDFPTFEDAASVDDEFWPVRDLLSRGYVACTVATITIDPDEANGFDRGIRGFFHRVSGSASKPTNKEPGDKEAWKALSAWGWGASRALDYLLTLEQIDPAKIAVIGHSRGGKAALWAAAEDTRFAIACSNNSGCGGAALSRRMYGETIERITTSFPHWFCDRFAEFAGKEMTLPIDQHQLFGLIAPRPVYATSATEDLWADPRGEYLSLVAAAPVFERLGEKSLQNLEMPAVEEPRIVGKTGYHIRSGKHGLTSYDWAKFLDFCDLQWSRINNP